MSDPTREWEPRTEAGRRLADHLNGIARTPYSGVSFPDIETDIRAIEAEAVALSTTPAPDALTAKLTEVIEDAESQHPGGWGPDVTTVAILREVRAALEGAPHE